MVMGRYSILQTSCDYISSKSPVTVNLLQVITATTRVARRGCRERLNRSAPYRHEHEL